MFGSTLGFLHDGVDNNKVPHDSQKADYAKDDREDGTAMTGPYSWREEQGRAEAECQMKRCSNATLSSVCSTVIMSSCHSKSSKIIYFVLLDCYISIFIIHFLSDTLLFTFSVKMSDLCVHFSVCVI